MIRIFKFVLLTIFTIFFYFNTLNMVAVYAWGDNSTEWGDDMRPNYTQAEVDNGALGDKIVFNSISDNSIIGDGKDGNEKNFVAAKKCGSQGLWAADDIDVDDGDEIMIRAYVHNNNPNGLISKNTYVFFNIPNTIAKSASVNAFLDSSNAEPNEYWDYVNLNSKNGTALYLKPIAGSAYIEYQDEYKSSIALSDNIWGENGSTQGVKIGYNKTDGNLPGGIKYSFFVIIRVKVIYDVEYSVETKVRLVGDKDKTWKKEVDANIDDKVEFQINYENTSDEIQNNVAVNDILPSNLKYVDGTTKIYNSTYPKGFLVDSNEVVASGIFIGTYESGANALIRFQAEVINDNFTCGKFVLHNWGRVTVNKNNKVVQDSAAVNVQLAYCPNLDENKKPNLDKNKKPNFALYLLIVVAIISSISLISFIYFSYKLWRYKKMR